MWMNPERKSFWCSSTSGYLSGKTAAQAAQNVILYTYRPTNNTNFNRQESSPSSLPSLVAGSSALLGALAVSILTPGSFPKTTTKATSTKNLPRCPTNWKDATHVGLGCVWAGTRGGGVSWSTQHIYLYWFWIIFRSKWSFLSHFLFEATFHQF